MSILFGHKILLVLSAKQFLFGLLAALMKAHLT